MLCRLITGDPLTVHSDGLVPLPGGQLQLRRVELSPLATVVQVVPPLSLLAVAGVVESNCLRRGDEINLQAQQATNHQPWDLKMKQCNGVVPKGVSRFGLAVKALGW